MSVRLLHTIAIATLVAMSGSAGAAPLNIVESPLFLSTRVAPLNMLVVGRDHKLYYEAYNDASDLDNDGTLDTRYKGYELKSPAPTDPTASLYKIDYYGYFDSYKCYSYTSSRFEPTSVTTDKTCSGAWSGDYLNYLTTSRIDALRKVLYGGDRYVDDAGETVLERSYIPQDAHSWGKEYDPAVDGYNITSYTPLSQPSTGRRHFFANTTPRGNGASDATLYNTPPLLRYLQNMPGTVRIWNWLSKERPVAHRATNAVDNITLTDGDFTDLIVRVKVCVSTPTNLREPNCQLYANGTSWKPTGIIQEYGEGVNPRMYFGLMTGSYSRNTNGGVLRKRLGSGTSPMANEIDSNTGQFLNLGNNNPAIIKTFTRMHTTGFGTNRTYDCGWDYSGGPLPSGQCQMWGNPIAEIMYEGLRYLGGRATPTTQFVQTFGSGNEGQLPGGGLPIDTWDDPYANHPRCAKPFETVISDINPSYDSDRLPGSTWAGTISPADLPGSLNVSALGQIIWDNEMGVGARNVFIGQVGTLAANNDNAPTAKSVSSFGDIRGLAPEEPTKQGSYYSASVAYHGNKTDIHPGKPGVQKVSTFAVALASPLPKIEIPINGRNITLVPFAKSPGGSVNNSSGATITFSPDRTAFQPTNQIVDFYVDELTATTGRFRVNFEDVEFGADHDMDAIVVYSYAVSGSTVSIRLRSEYASGSIKQHMGYVISGTTADGIYMEVRDNEPAASDVDYFLDTPPGVAPGGAWNDNRDLPYDTTRTFTAGSTTGADLLKNPLWYAAKWGGFEDSDADNLPDITAEWDENGDGDPDNYFLVTNALTLGEKLSNAFAEIEERVGSASAASVNAGSISSETRVYQARFNSGNWTGQLLSFPVNADGTLRPFEWDAGAALPLPASRKIITTNADSGQAVAFRWADIGAIRQGELQPSDTNGERRLEYVRGVASDEYPNGLDFRVRPVKLGDVVSSSPTFVGAPAFFYRDSLESVAYSTFVAAQANRQKMVYVGANDGMLHGFNATTGVEELAFIPSGVFANLHHLANRTYAHKYFVDGTPTVRDVFYNNNWHTVLVGGLNRGGKSIYALDITSPGSFSEANAANILRWEYTDADLGYTYSRPAIVRLRTGRWAAVFGNGYNNTGATGLAYLYIVDIEDGTLIRKIPTFGGSTTTPNGLATPALVDINSDTIIDYAYAGDLLGNMWKFDLTGATAASWGVSYTSGGNPAPIFVATDGAATPVRQPITSRPEVGRGPKGVGMVVLFGTGKFLESVDKTPGPKQTFYGIFDANTGNSTDIIPDRSGMVRQSILAERTVGTRQVRLTTANPISDTSRGWYLDLMAPSGTLQGEMQVSNSVLRNGRIIFTTLIPDPDVCSAGGSSWLMEIDSLMGARLAQTPFDMNNDGVFDDRDKVSFTLPDGTVVTEYVSGTKPDTGATETPGILTGMDGKEYKYLSGSGSASGSNLERIVENPGPNSTGRQSWRQVK